MEKLIEKFLNAHFYFDPKHFFKCKEKLMAARRTYKKKHLNLCTETLWLGAEFEAPIYYWSII